MLVLTRVYIHVHVCMVYSTPREDECLFSETETENQKTIEELRAELVTDKMKFQRLKKEYDLVMRELAVFSKETY